MGIEHWELSIGQNVLFPDHSVRGKNKKAAAHESIGSRRIWLINRGGCCPPRVFQLLLLQADSDVSKSFRGAGSSAVVLAKDHDQVACTDGCVVSGVGADRSRTNRASDRGSPTETRGNGRDGSSATV